MNHIHTLKSEQTAFTRTHSVGSTATAAVVLSGGGSGGNVIGNRPNPRRESLLFGNVHGSYNIIADLAHFVRFKSISSRPQCQTECWRAAHFIQNKCEQFGAETRLVQGVVGKNPVVLAKFGNSPNDTQHQQQKRERVRIVMYGHYDVVDINNEDGWTSPPFELTGKNGYLYGRGTTDNKGPIIVFVHAIHELLQQIEGIDGDGDDEEMSMSNVPLEIVLVIEGQEEHDWNRGGLKEVVERNMDWLADPTVIICSNSYWLGDTVPAISLVLVLTVISLSLFLWFHFDALNGNDQMTE